MNTAAGVSPEDGCGTLQNWQHNLRLNEVTSNTATVPGLACAGTARVTAITGSSSAVLEKSDRPAFSAWSWDLFLYTL